MERVAIDELEPATTEGGAERRSLTAALGAEDLSVNWYELDPGDRQARSVHAHTDQEELFVVVDGTVTFERKDDDVVVAAGEAVRFGPGEFQSGHNAGDEPATVLGLGAPRNGGDLLIARVAGVGDVGCPDCPRDDMRLRPMSADADVDCPDCGAVTDIE